MVKMLLAITQDIAKFFVRYAPDGCFWAMLITAGYLFYEGCGKRKCLKDKNKISMRKRAEKAACIFLLVLYGYIVIGITMFSRSESGTRYFSLELFRTFHNTFFSKKQICENIIMFIPYAILLFLYSNFFRKMWVMLGIGVVSSFLIEIMQWVTKTGYFELDDILTNVFGMILGYGICKMVLKMKNL